MLSSSNTKTDLLLDHMFLHRIVQRAPWFVDWHGDAATRPHGPEPAPQRNDNRRKWIHNREIFGKSCPPRAGQDLLQYADPWLLGAC